MELNLETKTLTYYQNGQNMGVAFHDIDTGPDIKYRMALFFAVGDSKAKLISFASM